MPSLIMTDCPDCGCGESRGDDCIALVTVYGKNYFDEGSQFEERTEYAGINVRAAYQIGVSLGEMLNGEYTGFRGTISEIQFIQCYENIVDAIDALGQHNPHFVFE